MTISVLPVVAEVVPVGEAPDAGCHDAAHGQPPVVGNVVSVGRVAIAAFGELQ
jgi:hypothetical protein